MIPPPPGLATAFHTPASTMLAASAELSTCTNSASSYDESEHEQYRSGQYDCKSSCTAVSVPEKRKQLYKKTSGIDNYLKGDEPLTFPTPKSLPPPTSSSLSFQPAPLRPRGHHCPPSAPIRRTSAHVLSPASSVISTPPLSPTSSMSSQFSANTTLSSNDHGHHNRAWEIGSEHFPSTPPGSPTRSKPMKLQMLAADEDKEDEVTMLDFGSLAPMCLGVGEQVSNVHVHTEEMPRAREALPKPASSSPSPPTLASSTRRQIHEEFIALLASEDRSRYGRTQQVNSKPRTPLAPPAERSRPAKLDALAVYEAKMDVEDKAFPPMRTEPEPKEKAIEVSVREVPYHSGSMKGVFASSDEPRYVFPRVRDTYNQAPSSYTSLLSELDDYLLSLSPAASDLRTASVYGHRSPTHVAAREWKTVEEYAAFVQNILADSKTRYRSLSEQEDPRTQCDTQTELDQPKATDGTESETAAFKKPSGLRDAVTRAAPRGLSLPWKKSMKQGLQKVKRWIRIIGSKKPSLADAAE